MSLHEPTSGKRCPGDAVSVAAAGSSFLCGPCLASGVGVARSPEVAAASTTSSNFSTSRAHST